jgi:hypothetical protein
VTKGKNVGVYLGRVAIKSDGYFKITGRPFGMVEGIHARYCRPLHRKDGYRYSKGNAALPPERQSWGPPRRFEVKATNWKLLLTEKKGWKNNSEQTDRREEIPATPDSG